MKERQSVSLEALLGEKELTNPTSYFSDRDIKLVDSDSETDAGAITDGKVGVVKKSGYLIGHMNPRTGKRRKLYVNSVTNMPGSRDSFSEVDTDEASEYEIGSKDNSDDERLWDVENNYPYGMPVELAMELRAAEDAKKPRKSKHANAGETMAERMRRKMQKAAKKAMLGI